MAKEWKPYELATIQLTTSKRRRFVQTISRPTPEGTIMVRMVPNDPTTMVEVRVADLQPPINRYRYCHVAEFTTSLTMPEDMLRYDGAALYDHTSCERELTERGTGVYLDPSQPVRVYQVSQYRVAHWTLARWRSFGCQLRHLATFDLTKEPGQDCICLTRAKEAV